MGKGEDFGFHFILTLLGVLVFTVLFIRLIPEAIEFREKFKKPLIKKSILVISGLLFIFMFFTLSVTNELHILFRLYVSLALSYLCLCFFTAGSAFLIERSVNPKYPEGKLFVCDVEVVYNFQNKGYKVSHYMYESSKYRMEQYMVKHGIIDLQVVPTRYGHVLDIICKYASPEAEAKHESIFGREEENNGGKQSDKGDWLL